MAEREISDLVYDTEAVERNLGSETFRIFRLHGFTESELTSLALLDTQTRGRSSADLYELLPLIATQQHPELGAEFMRTPHETLDDQTPLDLISDQANYDLIRLAIAVKIESE